MAFQSIRPGVAPGLDPSSLRAVRFVFDRNEKRVVVLDDVAIR